MTDWLHTLDGAAVHVACTKSCALCKTRVENGWKGLRCRFCDEQDTATLMTGDDITLVVTGSKAGVHVLHTLLRTAGQARRRASGRREAERD